jgi:hypothetical protein
MYLPFNLEFTNNLKIDPWAWWNDNIKHIWIKKYSRRVCLCLAWVCIRSNLAVTMSKLIWWTIISLHCINHSFYSILARCKHSECGFLLFFSDYAHSKPSFYPNQSLQLLNARSWFLGFWISQYSPYSKSQKYWEVIHIAFLQATKAFSSIFYSSH